MSRAQKDDKTVRSCRGQVGKDVDLKSNDFESVYKIGQEHNNRCREQSDLEI